MKSEYSHLYSEYIKKQIETYKTKKSLQRKLARIKKVQRIYGEFKWHKGCLQSWADVNEYNKERLVKVCLVVTVVLIGVLLVI